MLSGLGMSKLEFFSLAIEGAHLSGLIINAISTTI
jgi:hypothetical protein